MSYPRLAPVASVGFASVGFAVLALACGNGTTATTGVGGANTTSASTGAGTTTGTGTSTGAATGTGGAPTTSTSTGAGTSTSTTTGSAGGASSGTGGASTASASASGATSTGATSTGATSSNASAGATSGSASASSSSSSGGPATFGGACNGAHTILTGTVLAPNATDPIPNVRVYAAVQVNPYPTGYCGKCSAPIDTAYAATVTAPDGTFTLDLDFVPQKATITFVIQIGRFRKVTILPVTACQSAVVPATARTLPGAHVDGDIPDIAVSSGPADHLDAVLAALGITDYDCYEGKANATHCNKPATKNIADVLVDATQIGTNGKYHMAFLSCAPGAYKNFITPVAAGGLGYSQATMTANMQAWVAADNGRLFATDTAYDYIAQAFPTGITWAGPSGSPQPVDGADVGCSPPNNMTGPSMSYSVTIDDPLLAKWLEVGVHVLPTPPPNPPQVNILGFYKRWAVISSLPATTQLIANGTVPVDPTYSTTKCVSPQMQNVPLTTQFDVPTCGRVIFSSYHTDAGAAGNSAQQRIMEYLIFDAAFCHQ